MSSRFASLVSALLIFGTLGSDTVFAEDAPQPIKDESPKAEMILDILRSAVKSPFVARTVRTCGGVTMADPHRGNGIYIQDRTGGILVYRSSDEEISVGDYVEVQGVTTQGDFAPAIANAKLTKLGNRPLPQAHIASGGGVLNGAFNGERVRIDGWVRFAKMISPTIMETSVISGASRITLEVSNAETMDPESLTANKIIVEGVACAVNARGISRHLVDVHILVPSPQNLNLGTRDAKLPGKDEITPFFKIFQYRPSLSRGERIRVQGMVVHRQDDTLFLNNGESGLAVKVVNSGTVECGEWVDAVGFCDLENFLPSLSDAVITRIPAPSRTVSPKEYSASELFQGHQHANYVSVTGQLLDKLELPRKGTRSSGVSEKTISLTLQSPAGVYMAELITDKDYRLAQNVETGSILKLSGICMVDTDDKGNPIGFKLLIPTAKEITVAKRANFFTVKRLLTILCGVLIVLLGVVFRHLAITRRNTELIAEIRERNAVNTERSRLARDLHDNLEQGLTGISLHLQSIGNAIGATSPIASDSLQATSRLVKHCHSELRHAIWELRSPELEQFDLGTALQHVGESLISGLGIQIEMKQEKEAAVKLPSLVEDNLLRIGQESITNIVKHAAASQVIIELKITLAQVSLTISDNGQGFSDSIDSIQKKGHFGVQGMQERAQRIGGRLTLSKGSKSGCVVAVVVPIRDLSVS